MRNGIVLYATTALLGALLAQTGSFLIESYVRPNRSIEVLPFLHINHVRNLGGIFGLFQGKGWAFALVSALFLAGLTVYVIRDKKLHNFEYFCYGLILAGGMSNILDRFIYGSVIDFIDIRGIPYWKYIFNTADVMIHLGIWPLVIISLLASRRISRNRAGGDRPQAPQLSD